MTDRFDDLLIKARAEMLGKHTLRAEPSTDAVFETVWDNMQKGFFDGVKRGYKGKRRMPGRSGQLSDDQMSIYDQMRGPKPKRTRGPRQPKAPAPPITDESRMLPESTPKQPIEDESRMLPENTFSGSSTEVPHLEPITMEQGADGVYRQPLNDVGVQDPIQLPPPKDYKSVEPQFIDARTNKVKDGGIQEPPSAFEQGWNVSQRRDATNTADEWGNIEDVPPAPPEAESKVGLPWSPTLTESGPGSRLEDWNTRNRSIWGNRSKKGKAMAEYYASLEEPPEAEAPATQTYEERRAAAMEQLDNLKPGQSMDMSVFDKPDEPDEDEAPAPNAPTDVESATERAKGRQKKRESIPQQQQTLFDAPTPEAKPAPSGEGVPYGEYSKHIQAAMQGNEQSLQFLANNPDAVAQHSSGGLPQRIQDALTAMSGSGKVKSDKKKSHGAFNSAWSVLKDPFANPFDNPSAFAIHDNFNMEKAKRLPSETEMNSIRGVGEALSVSPDPPTMNAGMPRMKDMDAYYAEQQAARDETDKFFQNQEKLSAMGMDEIQARLSANPEHEGDWRHLTPEGLDRASMAEIAQLMTDINPVEKQYQNADMSLLPSSLLKEMKGQQQASADYSLLPQGWQEGVVE